MQTFNNKLENGYAFYIQTLNADNRELIPTLKDELKIKNSQKEQFFNQLPALQNKIN